MITHIVMWKFGTETELHEAKRRIETLPAIISEIKTFEAGIDFSRTPAAFDLALYSTFESKESLQKYIVHPEHQLVAQYIGSVATARSVVDYEH